MASFRIGKSRVRGLASDTIRGVDVTAAAGTVAPGTGMMLATKAPDAAMGFTKSPDAVMAPVTSLPSVTVTGIMKENSAVTVTPGDTSPRKNVSVTATPNRR